MDLTSRRAGRKVGLTVKQCAARAGVEAHVLRYYVRIGLLRPIDRSPNGYKLFSEDDVVRLRFIRVVQDLGCTLDEIRAILAAEAAGSRCCPHVQHLLQARIVSSGKRVQGIERSRKRLLRALSSWEQSPSSRPDGHAVHQLIESVGSTA